MGFDLVLVGPVLHAGLDVLKHPHHFDVGAAVLGTFEGGQRCGHTGVGVGSRGGDHMGGKGGVVAAAVLRVEHEADIQNVGLPEGVGGVGAEQREDVLRCGRAPDGGHG